MQFLHTPNQIELQDLLQNIGTQRAINAIVNQLIGNVHQTFGFVSDKLTATNSPVKGNIRAKARIALINVMSRRCNCYVMSFAPPNHVCCVFGCWESIAKQIATTCVMDASDIRMPLKRTTMSILAQPTNCSPSNGKIIHEICLIPQNLHQHSVATGKDMVMVIVTYIYHL